MNTATCVEQTLLIYLGVSLMFVAIVTCTKLSNWLEWFLRDWDADDRRVFEWKRDGDKEELEAVEWCRLQDGLLTVLTRSIFWPVRWYHLRIYPFVLTFFGYVGWRIRRRFSCQLHDTNGSVRFRMAIDLYNLSWCVLIVTCYMIALGFARMPCEPLTVTQGAIQGLIAILVILRLYEIMEVTTRLHFSNVYRTESPVRALVNTLWHYIFVVVIFAIFFVNVATLLGDKFAKLEDKPLLCDWASPLYFSMVTIATIGYGEFTPQTALGKGVVCAEVLVGLLLIVVVVARLISITSNQKE